MSTLLLKLWGNKTLNHTVWPPYLYIYDDLLSYKKRSWFKLKEITMSYNQIAQSTLQTGIFFATLEIITTGTDDIIIKYIDKKSGKKAKKIIDQKLYHAHSKLHPDVETDKSKMNTYEKSVNRLKELLNKGRITEKEYEKKKDRLLDNLD